MRKIFLFFTIAFSITIKAQLWFPQGAQWHYRVNSFPNRNGYVELNNTGTVTIGGKTCTNLNGTYYGTTVSSGTFVVTITNYQNINSYVDNSVVYVYNVNTLAFDTLVNFSAAIGDKWKIASTYYDPSTCTVTPILANVIDTGHVTINGVYLKKIALIDNAASITNTYVAKIGCVTGFFLPYSTCSLDEDNGSFVCYSDNNFPLYNNGSSVCKYVVGLNELKIKNDALKIYPNPSSGVVNLEVLDKNINNYTLKLTNILGKEEAFELIGKQENNLQLNISQLKKGIYILQVLDKGKLLYIEKIIKE